MENIPRFMTIHETAKAIKTISEHCIRQMAKRGELPAIKTGNKVLINYDRFLEMLNDLGKN